MIYAWKFIIGRDPIPDPDRPELEWHSCVTVVLAETEEAARVRLTEYANENGFNWRWGKIARVVKLEIKDRVVLCWSE